MSLPGDPSQVLSSAVTKKPPELTANPGLCQLLWRLQLSNCNTSWSTIATWKNFLSEDVIRCSFPSHWDSQSGVGWTKSVRLHPALLRMMGCFFRWNGRFFKVIIASLGVSSLCMAFVLYDFLDIDPWSGYDFVYIHLYTWTCAKCDMTPRKRMPFSKWTCHYTKVFMDFLCKTWVFAVGFSRVSNWKASSNTGRG